MDYNVSCEATCTYQLHISKLQTTKPRVTNYNGVVNNCDLLALKRCRNTLLWKSGVDGIHDETRAHSDVLTCLILADDELSGSEIKSFLIVV